MKKDRNTFFSDAHMQSQTYMPNMNMNMPMYNQGYAPYQASQASQSFYAGPTPTQNYQDSSYSELDSRLAKIERQINRLDSRITRLENGNGNLGMIEKDTNFSSSMYMV